MNLRTWLQSRLSRPSKPRHPVMKPRLQVESLESRVVPDCGGMWTAELVRSFVTVPGTIAPNQLTFSSLLVPVGDTLFFAANNGVSGQELWKSDGTAAETVLVKDIVAGAGGSTPLNLTAVGNTLYFTSGTTLWKSDGTEAGTVSLRAFTTPASGPAVAWLTAVGSTLFFAANSGTGVELWKSDGTAAGTVLVRDIAPGSNSSSPAFLANVGGTLFFAANDFVNSVELWKSDGTVAGTVLVKDIAPGSAPSSPSNLLDVGGTLFFTAAVGGNRELYKSNGTAAGTVLVKDIGPGTAVIGIIPNGIVGSTLYFAANNTTNGLELWKSDGTAAGTFLVKDIFPGSGSSNPFLYGNVNGSVFFRATDGINGSELWRSDGTAAGTTLIKDIFVGSGNSSLGITGAVVDDTVFFPATDGINGTELWMSDGTAAGTVQVADIRPGNSNPANLTALNGTVFFTATGTGGVPQLWRAIPGTGGTGADAGGPYTVAEGGTVVLDGSGNDGTVVWDLDGDGIFGETGTAAQRGNETGVNPTFSAVGLDGPGFFTVSIQATDECGTGTATTTITIGNAPPSVAANSAAVTANEGGTATNAGTFNDASPDTVTITASVGTVTQNNTTRTWNWSLNAVDGPAEPVTVTITATDDDGAASNATFTYSISNVAPSISLNGAATVNEGAPYTLNLGAVTDPGPDTITSHTIHWGDGTSNTYSGSPANTTRTHTYADGPANHTYTVAITDEDGTFLAGSLSVLVLNVAPTIALSGAGSVNEGSPYTLDLGAITDPGTDTVTAYTIHWGDGHTDTFSGNPAGVSRTHTYADGPNSRTITVSLTDEDGTYLSAGTLNLVVDNVAPALAEATFAVLENSPNGTVIGTVTGTDPGTDTLTYSITGGTGATAFAVNPISGQLTVIDSAQLDFETTPSFTLEVTVTDDDGATGAALVTVNLLNKASISGSVFVDTNQNGLYDANEMGIDCVHLELLDGSGAPVLDGHGNPVRAETIDGFYLFADLDPGTYRIREVQPTGVTDGAEQLGSLGGSIVANDTMQLTLADTDAFDYDFAEIGQPVTRGDTAGIGFWQNSRGQELITAGGSALAQWLTANFGNVFGTALAGADGAAVAAFYRNEVFPPSQPGPARVDAQFMALALSTYFTSRCLAGDVATGYGFTVTDTGIGTRVVNVGSSGAAFGVANNTNLTIMQLLLATNSLTDMSNNLGGFARTYDRNGDGVIDAAEAQLRAMANSVYAAINGLGGI